MTQRPRSKSNFAVKGLLARIIYGLHQITSP